LRDGDLTLRPPVPDDAEAVTAACQDAEIQRWTLVPSPYRREHAEEWLASAPGRVQAGEAVSLLAFQGDGRLAGSFSLMELDLASGSAEIGYWVAPWARGRGVATRSVLLVEEGTLYPALHRLERRGWIASEWGVSENNRKAKFYSMTAGGRARLRAESRVWQRNADAIAAVLRRTSSDAS